MLDMFWQEKTPQDPQQDKKIKKARCFLIVHTFLLYIFDHICFWNAMMSPSQNPIHLSNINFEKHDIMALQKYI